MDSAEKLSAVNRTTSDVDLIAKLLVGFGLLLRAIQLLVNRGLREDEGHLAINFVTRSLSGVLKPLDNGQVAPPLFLVIEKISMSVFGQNEYAIRGFAFLSSCAALILFYKFLKTHTNQWITVAAVAMMAINRSLIFFAVAVKQYSSDLLVILFIFYWIFNPSLSNARKYGWLGVIGAVAIWLSHTSIFVLFAAGVFLLFQLPKLNFADRSRIVVSGLVWLASFAVLYITMIAHHPNEGIMMSYWEGHFMPLIPRSLNDLIWFVNHFKFLIAYCFGFSPAHYVLWVPYGILFFAGIAYCFRVKEHRCLLWLLLPVVVHLIVSGLRIYPFYHRLILYLSFPVFVFVGFGIWFVGRRLQDMFSYQFLKLATAALIVVLLVVGLIDFPYPTEDIKKSLAVVKQNFSAGDEVFVYYPVDACFDFIAGTIFLIQPAWCTARSPERTITDMKCKLRLCTDACGSYFLTFTPTLQELPKTTTLLLQLKREGSFCFRNIPTALRSIW